ncbi:conserved hypothetical protein [Mycobacterium tuberculosis T92]|nr:conserved hypothetical protein [Mycobacterium tuberculosis T92]
MTVIAAVVTRDRVPVRAVHGVAGRDGGGGIGWAAGGAGVTRRVGATRVDPALTADWAVILCAVVCSRDTKRKGAAGGGRR